MQSAPVEKNKCPSGSTNHQCPSIFSILKKPVALASVTANPPNLQWLESPPPSSASSFPQAFFSSSNVLALPVHSPLIHWPNSSTSGFDSSTASPDDSFSSLIERISTVF